MRRSSMAVKKGCIRKVDRNHPRRGRPCVINVGTFNVPALCLGATTGGCPYKRFSHAQMKGVVTLWVTQSVVKKGEVENERDYRGIP
jgi:hypothetical protein